MDTAFRAFSRPASFSKIPDEIVRAGAIRGTAEGYYGARYALCGLPRGLCVTCSICRMDDGCHMKGRKTSNDFRTSVRSLLERNRLPEARRLCEERCRSHRDDAEAWLMLGIVNGCLGNFDRTVECCNTAITLCPERADAHLMLADALLRLGEAEQAEASYKRALSLAPDNPVAHFNLGVALGKQGRYGEAETSYRKALDIRPDFAEAHANLAYALRKQKKPEAAAEHYRRALATKPDDPELLYNLGLTLQDLRHHEKAVNTLRRVVRLKGDHGDAWLALAYTLEDMGDHQGAMHCYRKLLDLDPENARAYGGLAAIHYFQGAYETALASCQQALRLNPEDADTHFTLASIHLARGEHPAAIAACKKATELRPHFYKAQSNLLLILNYTEHDPEVLYREHVQRGRVFAPVDPDPGRFSNIPNPDRRLRIGYLSPDFRRHSVAWFMEPLLAKHDRTNVEVFCYSDTRRPDETTERLMRLADHWRDAAHWDDERLRRQIHADAIDILVDLAGHTADNRLRLFASRAAPVQLSYLGYPNTTGIPAMDYRLTDPWADPPGVSDRWHTEELIRLPQGFLCYNPPPDAPEVSPLPAQTNGYITFGSFNNLAKITPEVVTTWARILHGVPDARLVLKNQSFSDVSVRRQIARRFHEQGIEAERLDLLPPAPGTREHLDLYRLIDIGLDTFPYNGTTTTCEALWMGVPLICLEGRTHAGRVGVSLLNQVGLPDLIVPTTEEYIDMAIRLANTPDKLDRFRDTLRQQLVSSPLYNGALLADNLEDAFKRIWRAWCSTRLS